MDMKINQNYLYGMCSYTGEIMVVIEDKGVGIEDIEKARLLIYNKT